LRKASRWRRGRTGREVIALLTASLLHVGVFGLERLELREAPSPQRREPTNELEIGLWEREQPPLTEPSHGRQAEHVPTKELPRAPEVSKQTTPVLAPQGDELEQELSAMNGTEAAAPAAGPQESSRPSSPRPIDLGIGAHGWKRWVRDAQPGEPEPRGRSERRRPATRVPTASTTGGLQEGLEQHDRDLGFSPAGGIVSALYQAALVESPRGGHAVFAVTIARSGSVDIALGDSAGSGPEWQSVALRAAKSLRAKLPRIPSTRNGARVVVKILTEEMLPSGSKVGERAGPSALLPWLGDPADLGAKPQKIIRTRVQEETLF